MNAVAYQLAEDPKRRVIHDSAGACVALVHPGLGVDAVAQVRPELAGGEPLAALCGVSAVGVYLLAPVVGLCDEPGGRGGPAVIDAHHGDLDAEESGVLIGSDVQPVQRRPVCLVERRRAPHDVQRIRAAGVGEQLAQMSVVGPLELILHDDYLAGGQVRGRSDRVEPAVAVLRLGELELHPEHVGEDIRVEQ